MYYLEKGGVKNVQAQIDYPLIRETKKIYLEDDDRKILENIKKNIKDIKRQEKPPHVINKKMCKNCAYYDLCYV